jgi:hypothetical protein
VRFVLENTKLTLGLAQENGVKQTLTLIFTLNS